jgi:CRISPR/Cas system Type II protein with McrA/HNH and RuvC-like nuclease domain
MDCVTQFKLDNYKRFCQLCGTEVSNKKKFCPVCVEIIGLTSKLRFEVFKRDKFTCKYCGRVIKDGIKLEVDHIIPVSKGGKSNMDNLVTACKDCNRGKSDNLLNEICKK